MSIAARLALPTARRACRERVRHAPAPASARSEPPRNEETVGARRAGPIEDRAFYACGCGYAFTADVTTTVRCPHCGTGQAW